MSRKLVIVYVSLLATATCLAQEAATGGAAYEVYGDETSYLAAVGEVGYQSFESFPRSECSTGGPDPVTVLETESFTVETIPVSGTSFLCTGFTDGIDPRPTDGQVALIAGSITGSPWTLTFALTGSRPAHGVAFYLTDAAESGDAIFVLPTGERITMASCCQSSAQPIFFGIVTRRPFRSFELENTGVGDGWGIDEVMLAIGARGSTKLR